MERVGKVLANLKAETSTPSLAMKTYDEPTIEERREELRRSLGVSSFENTFENFDPVKGTEKALQACRVLVGGKAKWKMLMLYGGVGNGKTHLLEALVVDLYKQGIRCGISTYSKMMSTLRSTMDKDSHISFDYLLDRWCRAERMVIDDVGIGGSDTAWSMKMLEEIILARYRDNRFTVLSTNVDISELPERVVSRFKDPQKARMILNTAPDYRPENRRG